MELNQSASVDIHLSQKAFEWEIFRNVLINQVHLENAGNSTSLIISWTWLSVGFWPIDLRTAVSSFGCRMNCAMFKQIVPIDWLIFYFCVYFNITRNSIKEYHFWRLAGFWWEPWKEYAPYCLCQMTERPWSKAQKGLGTPSASLKRSLSGCNTSLGHIIQNQISWWLNDD